MLDKIQTPKSNPHDSRKHSAWVSMVVMTTAFAVLLSGQSLLQPRSAFSQDKKKAAPAKKAAQPSPKKPKRSRIPNPFPNRRLSASLDGGTGWLNTSGEITLKDLRGKVVLLDFWTYCCINCMHVLPDLKFLEKKYAKEIVVIGVHSAKFANEKESDNIRRAIVRYEIEHPVINDSNMQVWRKFGVNSWPTLVLIDPEGFYCGYISGEGHREILDEVIKKLIVYHKSKGTLDTTPVRFDLEREKLKPSPLKFPGKLLADEPNNRLFISDSNHNRIVISTLDGQLIDIIGTGAMGANDGAYNKASFDHPQGMELIGETLYVADTENHLIRTVDLKQKTVSTLAGTGKQARRRVAGGSLKKTALNSPWDLLHADGKLFIAMAGPHQIWSHKLGSNRVRVYAGSGRENITDGPLDESALAQPSGLALDGKVFYVADSEGSAIRAVPLNPRGEVNTIVGPTGSLFAFGDVDDVGNKIRLQHPLGVEVYEDTLYIADTYNHKIKKVPLGKNQVASTTLYGDGQEGNSLDPIRFSEPSGLTAAGGKLFIADTNNHRVCVADLKTNKVSVFEIKGLAPPKQDVQKDAPLANIKEVIQVDPQTVAAGETVEFRVALALPKEFKLNKLAPVVYQLDAAEGQDLLVADKLGRRQRSEIDGATAQFSVPLSKKAGETTLDLKLTYAFCRDGVGGLCRVRTVRWQIPFKVDAGAKGKTLELKTGPVE